MSDTAPGTGDRNGKNKSENKALLLMEVTFQCGRDMSYCTGGMSAMKENRKEGRDWVLGVKDVL